MLRNHLQNLQGFGHTESSSLIKVHNFCYSEAIPHYKNGHGIPWRDVSTDVVESLCKRCKTEKAGQLLLPLMGRQVGGAKYA